MHTKADTRSKATTETHARKPPQPSSTSLTPICLQLVSHSLRSGRSDQLCRVSANNLCGSSSWPYLWVRGCDLSVFFVAWLGVWRLWVVGVWFACVGSVRRVLCAARGPGPASCLAVSPGKFFLTKQTAKNVHQPAAPDLCLLRGLRCIRTGVYAHVYCEDAPLCAPTSESALLGARSARFVALTNSSQWT